MHRILRVVLKLLEKLEWSGERYFYDDKCTLPECPICFGHKPLGDEDDERYRGHSKGCELAAVIENLKERIGRLDICNAIWFLGYGTEHVHCTLPRGHIGHHQCDYPGGCAEWLNSRGSLTSVEADAAENLLKLLLLAGDAPKPSVHSQDAVRKEP